MYIFIYYISISTNNMKISNDNTICVGAEISGCLQSKIITIKIVVSQQQQQHSGLQIGFTHFKTVDTKTQVMSAKKINLAAS